MSELRVTVNKIINSDKSVNVYALRDILLIMNKKIDENKFSNFTGRKVSKTLSEAVSNYAVPHGLNFIPNFAIIVKQVSGTPTVTFDFSLFTKDDIFITTDAAVSIDVLVGRLDE